MKAYKKKLRNYKVVLGTQEYFIQVNPDRLYKPPYKDMPVPISEYSHDYSRITGEKLYILDRASRKYVKKSKAFWNGGLKKGNICLEYPRDSLIPVCASFEHVEIEKIPQTVALTLDIVRSRQPEFFHRDINKKRGTLWSEYRVYNMEDGAYLIFPTNEDWNYFKLSDDGDIIFNGSVSVSMKKKLMKKYNKNTIEYLNIS